MRSPDTSLDAYRRQIEILRRMSDSQRMLLGLSASDDVRDLVACGIRDRHPDYGEIEVQQALRRLWLGDDLFRAAYPGEALVDP
jgi:hypothetical protein